MILNNYGYLFEKRTVVRNEVAIMEVREALQKRRSIRKYTEDAVSKEQLEELLYNLYK